MRTAARTVAVTVDVVVIFADYTKEDLKVDIIYSTDSEEHLVNTGEISQPQWCELTQFEMQEDINAMNDYLDDVLNND